MTIFEKIINREIKAKILYEDDKIIAFFDQKPISEGHFLVVLKKHVKNLFDIEDHDLKILIMKAKKLAKEFIEKNKTKTSFKLIINNGKKAGQEIFHIHIHIIPY